MVKPEGWPSFPGGPPIGRGVGVEDAKSSRVDRLEAELRLDRRAQALAAPLEEDQPLPLRQGEQLLGAGEVALGQVRERRAEDEPEPSAGEGGELRPGLLDAPVAGFRP